MKMENLQGKIDLLQLEEEKRQLRRYWSRKRSSLAERRKQEASLRALNALSGNLNNHKAILSYASFKTELCTHSINRHLALKGLLLLPRIKGSSLHIYHVKNPLTQLVKNSKGILEPIPELCEEADPGDISLALIPGLAFDFTNNRLGYGGGYYDRFLPQLSPNASIFGLGYEEQFQIDPLPVNEADYTLDGLLLF